MVYYFIFIYFLISYSWSESTIWNITTQKQILILLLPVLYTLNFKNNYINKAKHGFIIGLFINILLSMFTIIYPQNSFLKGDIMKIIYLPMDF